MATRTKVVRTSGRYVLLTGVAVILIFPFYWAFTSSLKSDVEQVQFPPAWWPSELLWSNYIEAWTAQPFGQFFMNSMFVTVLSVIGVTFSSALVAYGFARFEFKGKNVLFVVLLTTMIIPWDVLVVPLYMQYTWFGWIDTFLPLIVPNFFGVPFYIFLLTQFLRTIPRELEEAALLDGAGHFRIFWSIFLPILRPQLALTAILHMIVVWNDFLGPLVFLNDSSKFTLPIGLSFFKTAATIDTTSMLAISVIMIVPPLIAFFVGQRHILNSDVSTGLKG